MNNADMVQALVNFTVADHNYIRLLTGTLIQDGRFTPPLNSPEAMRRIREAKAKRDSLEVEMYAQLEEALKRRPS